MRRSLRYLLLIPAVLLLVLIIAVGWVAGTNEGASWLLKTVTGYAPLTIGAKALEGTLIGGLRIRELRLSRPDIAVEIRDFTLRWQPADLLLGRITVNELSAEHVRIRDSRPESAKAGPLEAAWPRMTGILSRLSIGVHNLRVEDFSYSRRGKALFIVNRAAAEVRLAHGILSVRRIVFVMPQLAVDGGIRAGFSRPFLRADLTIAPPAPPAGLDRFRLDLRMRPAARSEAEGTLTITGMSGPEEVLRFESRVAVTSRSVQLSGIHASRPGRRGELTGRAEIVAAAESPAVSVEFAFKDVDLSGEIRFLNELSGNVRIDGSLREYHGSLSLIHKGTGWRNAGFKADFRGTPDRVVLTSMTGRLLEGTISGSAMAAWKERIFAEASLRLRGIDPGAIASEWPGTVNMDVKGAVRVPKDGMPQGEVSLRLLKSRVRDRALTGQARARLRKKNLLLDRLDLRGSGFDLRARGALAERIDLAVRLSDLSLFREGLQGAARIEGWIRQRKALFSASLRAHGSGLAGYGAKASSLEAIGVLEDRKGSPFTLSLILKSPRYGVLRADSVKLEASGTAARQTLRARLRSSAYSIETRLAGGFRNGHWEGEILQLSGSDPMGRWSLQQPSSLKISGDALSLSPFLLRGPGPERVQLFGTIRRAPLSGSFSAEWRSIDVSRANAWLSGLGISGFTSGRIAGRVLSDESFDVAGNLAVSRGSVRRRFQTAELKAEVSKADISVRWRGEKLEGNASVVLARYGRVDARLEAPLAARLPVSLNREGPFLVSVRGNIRETGTLSFLFPGLVQESRGEVEIDIRANGTLKAPNIEGSVRLDKAGGYFPAAGIHISDIQADARIERDRISIDSLKARSGSGTLEGKAVIMLSGWTPARYEGTLRGERFQALFLPAVRMLLSPDIRFSGTGDKLTARGEMRVPELLIYGPPSEAALEPSEDVVIVGQEEETGGRRRLSMDVGIKVILGDRVIVKAEGADARLGGEVLLSVRSIDRITGRGEIRVIKGRYSAYGMSLDITRGRIFFPGGPVDNPALDILAVKTIEEIKAGVAVTGTMNKPEVRLYSQPAMPDADILAYMVLGHPLGQDREQGSYLMRAAGALLSAGQSVALQDQVRQRLGLDTIDIETGGGGVSRSLVTIGKYLSSRLYVSYGRELFTGENLFRLRYKFGKRWELESQSGATSGVDLFYTIQFD